MEPTHRLPPAGALPCVPYSAIRAELRSGDILLCAGTAFFSRLIQRATGSLFSHVGIFWLNQEADRVMVYESVESTGVINQPFSRYLSNYKNAGTPYPGRLFIARHRGFADLTPQQRQTFLQYAIDVQGYAYDSQEIARIAVALAAPALAWDATFPEVTAGNRFICSVYAGETFAAVGLPIAHGPRPFLAPADFPLCPDVRLLWEIHVDREARR